MTTQAAPAPSATQAQAPTPQFQNPVGTQFRTPTVDSRGREELRLWLVAQRNDGRTPDVIARSLIECGWDQDSAAAASLDSLRSRDRHQLPYLALCWGVGLAALSLGSAGHLALDRSGELNHWIRQHASTTLATLLTVAVVTIPIAVVAFLATRRIEASEPHALWSPTRRSLFGAFAVGSGAIGILRLLEYVHRVISALVGVDGYQFTLTSLAQVGITLGIATPLFVWSLREWKRSNVARSRLGA